MIARSDRIAAVTALASFVVEIDLSDRFQAARLSASGRTRPPTLVILTRQAILAMLRAYDGSAVQKTCRCI